MFLIYIIHYFSEDVKEKREKFPFVYQFSQFAKIGLTLTIFLPQRRSEQSGEDLSGRTQRFSPSGVVNICG